MPRRQYDVALAPHCPLGPVALAACLHVDFASWNAVLQEQSIGIHYNTNGELLDYVVNKEAFDLERGCMRPFTLKRALHPCAAVKPVAVQWQDRPARPRWGRHRCRGSSPGLGRHRYRGSSVRVRGRFLRGTAERGCTDE